MDGSDRPFSLELERATCFTFTRAMAIGSRSRSRSRRRDLLLLLPFSLLVCEGTVAFVLPSKWGVAHCPGRRLGGGSDSAVFPCRHQLVEIKAPLFAKKRNIFGEEEAAGEGEEDDERALPPKKDHDKVLDELLGKSMAVDLNDYKIKFPHSKNYDNPQQVAESMVKVPKRKRTMKSPGPVFGRYLEETEEDAETARMALEELPGIPVVEVDDMGNRIGGANPYDDEFLEEGEFLQMGGSDDDWPEVLGDAWGMDDPPNAPWRLEAETLIRNAIKDCELTCYDIMWAYHKLEITVTRGDLPDDHEDAGYVESAQLTRCIRAVTAALNEREEDLNVLVRHEVVMATPGTKDILTTDREFAAFRGFDVVVLAGGPPSPNLRELRGKLVERTFDELIISQKGRPVRIPLMLVEEVRLPEAGVEAGDWLEKDENVVIPSPYAIEEEEEEDDDDDVEELPDIIDDVLDDDDEDDVDLDVIPDLTDDVDDADILADDMDDDAGVDDDTLLGWDDDE